LLSARTKKGLREIIIFNTLIFIKMANFQLKASQPNSDGSTQQKTFNIEADNAYNAYWKTLCEFEGTLVSIHAVVGYTKRQVGQAEPTFYKTGSEEPPLSDAEKAYANIGYTAGYAAD
jgi:hypothetical protein